MTGVIALAFHSFIVAPAWGGIALSVLCNTMIQSFGAYLLLPPFLAAILSIANVNIAPYQALTALGQCATYCRVHCSFCCLMNGLSCY